LQSANPGLQANVHLPPMHCALLALVGVQGLAHPPQWLGVLSSDISQPSLTPPLQLPQPLLQVIEQVPFEHEGVPLAVEHS
jgi:hypothetical protein